MKYMTEETLNKMLRILGANKVSEYQNASATYDVYGKDPMKKIYVDITHKSQQRDKKTVEQATKVIISEDNLEYFLKVLDNMSDITVENSIDGIADFKLSQGIHTPDTVVYFFHGTAVNEMLAKKSAKFVKKHYPNTTVKCFKGKFHCENALFHPEIMIEELDKIFDK